MRQWDYINFSRLYVKCNNQRGVFVRREVPPICQAHSPFLSVLIQFILHADPMVSQYKEIAVFLFYHPFLTVLNAQRWKKSTPFMEYIVL